MQILPNTKACRLEDIMNNLKTSHVIGFAIMWFSSGILFGSALQFRKDKKEIIAAAEAMQSYYKRQMESMKEEEA